MLKPTDSRPPTAQAAAWASAATLHEALGRAAGEHGDRELLVSGETRWTLARLLGEAERIGVWLGGTVPARTPVLLVPRNTPQSIAFVLGAIACDRVPVLADPAWTADELAGAMARAGIATAVWDGRADDAMPGDRQTADGFEAVTGPGTGRACDPRVAFARFTSGTTGTARCLGFTESAALAAARSWGSAAGYGPDDRVLCLATLNNGLAFNAALFAVLLSGAQLIFHTGRLLPRALARTMSASSPTVLVAFPFVYGQLTGTDIADDSLAALRLAVSSAARLDPAVKEAWATKSEAPMCDYYGLVEVGPCTFNDGTDPSSVGRVLPGVTIAVTDDAGEPLPAGETGRVRVHAHSMAYDFLDGEDPRMSAGVDANGFYVTRDLGYLDSRERLHLTGRVGRQVNIEGRKIEPAEVEEVLRAIPGVRDAIVVAEHGSARAQLAAYVEATGLSRSAVAEHCGKRLAAYKVPQRIAILERLPRSSTGKVSVGRLKSVASTEGGR